MLLLIDNYDSFTYNLQDYLAQLDFASQVVRNDQCTLQQIKDWQPEAIVISPGPETPSKAGITMPLIQHFYTQIPIVGICLGHQAIGEFFGARLDKASRPMHGMTSLIHHTGHAMFGDLPRSFEVMRYHSLCLYDLENTPLIATAHTSTGEIMALAHRSLPLVGCQFHPESILTEYGLQILEHSLQYVLSRQVSRCQISEVRF